jgi:hypothetical protein
MIAKMAYTLKTILWRRAGRVYCAFDISFDDFFGD